MENMPMNGKKKGKKTAMPMIKNIGMGKKPKKKKKDAGMENMRKKLGM